MEVVTVTEQQIKPIYDALQHWLTGEEIHNVILKLHQMCCLGAYGIGITVFSADGLTGGIWLEGEVRLLPAKRAELTTGTVKIAVITD